MGAGEDILRAMNENMATLMNRLDTIEKKVDRLSAHLGADRQAGAAQAQGGRVAGIEEIGGDKGDPKIGKDPKQWKGEKCEGRRASQCPPDFLDTYADFLDWKADNPREGKEKYARFDRLDAARCRRWSVEIREGRVTQAADAPPTPRSNGAPPAKDDSWGGGGDEWNDDATPF